MEGDPSARAAVDPGLAHHEIPLVGYGTTPKGLVTQVLHMDVGPPARNELSRLLRAEPASGVPATFHEKKLAIWAQQPDPPAQRGIRVRHGPEHVTKRERHRRRRRQVAGRPHRRRRTSR